MKFQEDVGLKSITDGEFRRTYFHIDFLEQLGGVKTDIPVTIRKPDGTEELAPPVIRVIDKVRHAKDIQKADFEYLKSQVAAGHTPKVTIPSPTMLHFRGGRAGISKEAYPELDPAFYDDVAKAYGDELRSLYAAGCRYVQMDDTNLAYLCDEKMREAARQRGDDPNELPHRYAKFINKVVAQKPQGMLLAMHLCRGNFKSTHAAAGNYEPVAEALLKEMDLDAYFLEYDDDALRRLPPAALPAQGQDRGAGPGDHQVRPAGRARTRSSAASTKPPSTRRWSSWRCRRSAASPAPCTATTSPWKTSATSCAWWSRRRRRCGAPEPAFFTRRNTCVHAGHKRLTCA